MPAANPTSVLESLRGDYDESLGYTGNPNSNAVLQSYFGGGGSLSSLTNGITDDSGNSIIPQDMLVNALNQYYGSLNPSSFNSPQAFQAATGNPWGLNTAGATSLLPGSGIKMPFKVPAGYVPFNPATDIAQVQSMGGSVLNPNDILTQNGLTYTPRSNLNIPQGGDFLSKFGPGLAMILATAGAASGALPGGGLIGGASGGELAGAAGGGGALSTGEAAGAGLVGGASGGEIAGVGAAGAGAGGELAGVGAPLATAAGGAVTAPATSLATSVGAPSGAAELATGVPVAPEAPFISPEIAAPAPAVGAGGVDASGVGLAGGASGASTAGGVGGAAATMGESAVGSQLWDWIKQNFNLGTAAQLASLASGAIGINKAGQMEDTAKQAAAEQDPFAPYRAQYAKQLAALMANPSSITSLPGYNAGLQAVQRSLAAQGYNGSGNMMAALANYGQQAYQNQVNTLATLAGANFSPTGGNTLISGTNAADNLLSSSLGSIGFGLTTGQLGALLARMGG